MRYFIELNIVRFLFIATALLFSLLIYFNFWDEFLAEELLLVTNGFGIFFLSAPFYYLFIRGHFEDSSSNLPLVALVKGYSLTFENLLFISSSILFIWLSAGFDMQLILSIIEHYLFLTCFSFVIYWFFDRGIKSLAMLFFYSILAFYKL
ncbi:hypothetical protein A3SI_19476 [Nitritalea halalkaliphila LW7]|uniref:Uncharacterized protein n=1 Tax=Nitritalea halalkaliphila LW7 TaxID=1189621 RepID=I5BSP0_9BACT|nr:hypothetical protein A3SI_19476 [Nitritalea halalkaliphila LW7]